MLGIISLLRSGFICMFSLIFILWAEIWLNFIALSQNAVVVCLALLISPPDFPLVVAVCVTDLCSCSHCFLPSVSLGFALLISHLLLRLDSLIFFKEYM